MKQRIKEELNDLKYNYFFYYQIKPSLKDSEAIAAIIKKKASDTNPKNPRLARELKNDAEEIMVHDATYDAKKDIYVPNKGGRKKELDRLKKLLLKKHIKRLDDESKQTKIVLSSLVEKTIDSPANQIAKEKVFTSDELIKEIKKKGFWVLSQDEIDSLYPKEDAFNFFEDMEQYFTILRCHDLYEYLGVAKGVTDEEINLALTKRKNEWMRIPPSNRDKKNAYSKLNGKIPLILQKKEQRELYDIFLSFENIWEQFSEQRQYNDYTLRLDQFSSLASDVAKKTSRSLEEAGKILFIGMRHYGLHLDFGEEGKQVPFDVDSSLKKAEIDLADGKFEDAEKLLSKIVLHDPENPIVYLLSLLCDYRCKKIEELENLSCSLENNTNFIHACEYADEMTKNLLFSINAKLKKKEEEKNMVNARLYASAMNLKNVKRYQDAYVAFKKILGYRDSAKQAEECRILQGKEDLYQKGISLKRIRQYQDAISTFEQIKDYKDSLSQIIICRRQMSEMTYNDALNLKAQGKYEEAIALFEKIKTYKDSSSQINFCSEQMRLETIYQKALSYKNAKKYSMAISAFEQIIDYKNSKDQIALLRGSAQKEKYNDACMKMSQKRYKEAMDFFKEVEMYFDSKEKIKECTQSLYNQAISYKRNKNYNCAIPLFAEILSYKDSKDQKEECQRLHDIQVKKLLRQRKRKKGRKKRIIMIVSLLVLLAVALLILTFSLLLPSIRQSDIQNHLDNKEYEQAYTLIEKNRNFGDNQNLRAMYKAGISFDNSDYEAGIDSIYNIGGTIDISYDFDGGTAQKKDETIKRANPYIQNDATKNGYVFNGWKVDSYSLSSKNHSAYLNLKAFFVTEKDAALGIHPIVDKKNKTISYGLYPQSHVSDKTLISSLNALSKNTESNGYYLFEDSYYAKKVASPYDSSYTYSDGEKIVKNITNWFKCEPIQWEILSFENGEYTLLSNLLLVAEPYDSSSYHYRVSDIRSFLIYGFYNSSFSLNSSYIQTTSVDNSEKTTFLENFGQYSNENTSDKVYLLSYEDYMNASYFPDDESRCSKPTDYAKANGAYSNAGNDYGRYWTRSTRSTLLQTMHIIDEDGKFYRAGVSNTGYGVRPAITIKI